MSTEPDGKPEAVTETWLYGGVREFKGKRLHAWTDGDGKERLYEKGAFGVGNYYLIDVERSTDDDGRPRVSILASTIRYTHERADDETRQELSAADAANKAILASAAAERKAAREEPLDDLLQPLGKIWRGLKTRPERDAFMALVMRTIMSPPK